MLLKAANVKFESAVHYPSFVVRLPYVLEHSRELIALKKKQYSYNLNCADHRTSLTMAEKVY